MKKLILTALISMWVMTFLWSLNYKPILTTFAQLANYYSLLPADTLQSDVLRIDDTVGDHSAHPSLNFGDGDAGLYESADDILITAVGGIAITTTEDSGVTFDSTIYISSNSEEFRFFANTNKLTIGSLANTDLFTISGDTVAEVDSILQVVSDTKEFRFLASASELTIGSLVNTDLLQIKGDTAVTVDSVLQIKSDTEEFRLTASSGALTIGPLANTNQVTIDGDTIVTIEQVVYVQYLVLTAGDTAGKPLNSIVAMSDSLWFKGANEWHSLGRPTE